MYDTDPASYFGPELWEVLSSISNGTFGDKEELGELVNTIQNKNDFYLLGADFASYVQS